MQSLIIAFILVGIVIVSQTSAKSRYNDDDLEEELVRALSSMKRTTPAKISTTSRCTEIIAGKDYNGGDMDNKYVVQVLSPAACAALCEQYHDCVAWTFNVAYGNCWVKSKIPALTTSGDNFTGTCKSS
ncbi:unnamed protein product [Adineta steineri]|uniref:Apple domain-containing protein n=1 Tax=Adineta steineri TaxID=433720 RepID=A0A819I6W1_9BILA|nr:unnamed protein product [Adineta steineri]CAF3908839.1 unnamed protein product [Adineta steineri]